MNTLREQQKELAIELMNKLDIYKPYIKAFKDNDAITLYEQYGGYYIEETTSIMFEGVNGKAIMSNITNYFRCANITKLGGVDVLIKEDYLARKRTQVQKKSVQKLTLPVSDVVKFILDNNQWVVLRPSGTEPKLKIYFSSKGSTLDETKSLINAIKTDVLKIVEIVKETNA